jgi:hypothetical protein
VKASRPDRDGGGAEHRAAISKAAQVRFEGEDFSSCFEELKEVVATACERQGVWEAKVIAGIRTVAGFAAANPSKALALSVEARRPDSDGRASDVNAYFAARLADLAPSESRIPISTDQGVVEAIALIIRGHLLNGTSHLLPEAAPDMVYLALMPYIGLRETQRWTEVLTLGETLR